MKICPKCKSTFYSNKCRCGYKPNLSVVKETPKAKIYEKKCGIIGCSKEWTERFNGYSILMCMKHANYFYQKIEIDQFVEVEIMLSRKFEEEAKVKGMTNYEYYKFCNPPGKSFFADVVFKNFRGEKSPEEISKSVDKKIEQDRIIASHNENMVLSTPEIQEIDFLAYDALLSHF